MKEIFDLVRENVDIVEVVSRYVKLKRVGSSYRGMCPFHFETEPRTWIVPWFVQKLINDLYIRFGF